MGLYHETYALVTINMYSPFKVSKEKFNNTPKALIELCQYVQWCFMLFNFLLLVWLQQSFFLNWHLYDNLIYDGYHWELYAQTFFILFTHRVGGNQFFSFFFILQSISSRYQARQLKRLKAAVFCLHCAWWYLAWIALNSLNKLFSYDLEMG